MSEMPSAEIMERLDDYAKRIVELENAGASLKTEDYLRLGKDYYYKGEYQDAHATYERALKLHPSSSGLWFNKGLAFSGLKRHDEALAAYDKAIEIKPDYVSAIFNRVCTYALTDNKEKALEDLKKAIELDGKYKKMAREDKDCKSLWDDPDFKRLTAE